MKLYKLEMPKPSEAPKEEKLETKSEEIVQEKQESEETPNSRN